MRAFEAEVEQWPFTFPGMLGSVVLGRLGVSGVVVVGGEEGAGGEPEEGELDGRRARGKVEEGALEAPDPDASHTPMSHERATHHPSAAAHQHQHPPADSPRVQAFLRALRGELRPARTVVRLRGTEGGWLRGRNGLLRDVKAGSGEEGRVLICEGGVCRERQL